MKRNTAKKEAVEPLKIFPQFKRIALHVKPHADEILAWMMLQTKAAEEVFPNLDINNVEWVTDNHRFYRDHPECLHIGCGKDPRFDEHTHSKNNWDSSCTMMAKVLGLLDHPWWRKTIENVRREDRHARTTQGEIAWMIKSLYKSHSGSIEEDMKIVRWAEMAYWAEIESAKSQDISKLPTLTTKTARILLEKQNHPDLNWFNRMAEETRKFEEVRRVRAKEDFLKQAKCFSFKHETLGVLKIFAVESDNDEMASVCWKMGADILIIRKLNGHTAIQTRRELGLSMAQVHAKLVEFEPKGDGKFLWVLAGEESMILNGSKSFPDVVSSGFSLPKIAEIIQGEIGDNGFMHFAMSYSVLEKELSIICK